MACFATPYGLRYTGHCFNRADAQNNRPALIPAGGKLGVTSPLLFLCGNMQRLSDCLIGRESERFLVDHNFQSLTAFLKGVTAGES